MFTFSVRVEDAETFTFSVTVGDAYNVQDKLPQVKKRAARCFFVTDNLELPFKSEADLVTLFEILQS